jgi:quinoprotein glucose dehydrogenase
VVTKTNMVFVFNRLTGEPLYPIVERPVPASTLQGDQAWPTQPFSTLPLLGPQSFTAADIHLHDPADQRYCEDIMKHLDNRGLFTPVSRSGTIMFPASLGGANWGSAAFDPATSVLYTRVSNLPFWAVELPNGTDFFTRIERRALPHLPDWMGGTPAAIRSELSSPDSGNNKERDISPQYGSPYLLERQALVTPAGVPCGPEPFGAIVAINLDTGKKVWSVPHGVMVKGESGSVGDGGVIVTAGGLVFAASTNDPWLRGYDSKTGKELWRGQLPVPSNATPMTYSVHGRQYVVIAAGGHGFIGMGKNDQVIAFALPETTPKHGTAHR